MATGRSETNKGESKLIVRLYCEEGKSYKVIEIIVEIEINEGNVLSNKAYTRRPKEKLSREKKRKTRISASKFAKRIAN